MEINSPVRPGALSFPGAAAYIGVGLTKFKELVRDGHVRAVHIGRRAVAPVDELDRYLRRLLDEQGR